MTQQVKSKGGSAFKAISDRLVVKSCSDFSFGKDAANMLKDKELKAKQQEIAQIKADWSRVQMDIMKSKLSLTDADADKVAQEQSKKSFWLSVWKIERRTSTLHQLQLRQRMRMISSKF